MRFNPRGLIVTAAGALVLWLALQTHPIPVIDFAFRIALRTILLILSGMHGPTRVTARCSRS